MLIGIEGSVRAPSEGHRISPQSPVVNSTRARGTPLWNVDEPVLALPRTTDPRMPSPPSSTPFFESARPHAQQLITAVSDIFLTAVADECLLESI
jgi:hypothetical protein